MMRQWLQHAFAIEPAEAFRATPAEAELTLRLRHELQRRQLTLPAVVLLESFRPLGYLGAQCLWATYPWFAALTDAAGLKVLAAMIERPGGVDYLVDRLQAEDVPVNVHPAMPRDCNPAAADGPNIDSGESHP